MRRSRSTDSPTAATIIVDRDFRVGRAPSFALTESQNSRANYDLAGASV